MSIRNTQPMQPMKQFRLARVPRMALFAATVTYVTVTANAAGFWKGTGQDSDAAANWTNNKRFMNGDNFYFRDAKMTGTDYSRYMRLTADVDCTTGHMVFFQCGTEDDPFVIYDDGNNHTIRLKYKNSGSNGIIYIGHSKNANNTNADETDDAGYYGSAVLNGGTWTCNQLYVGDIDNGTNYWGYLRLNSALLTVTGASANDFDNGKIVVDAGGTLSYTGGGGDFYEGRSGGTIDSGNYAISIAAAISGGSGLTFTGGNTITLTGAVSYSGATAVTPGTTLATSSATTKNNILNQGLVIAGIPNVGDEIFIVTKDGETISEEQLAKVKCPFAPTATFALGEGGTNIVVATVGDVLANYWTGAVDNDLSNDANWSSGVKPTGEAIIYCTTNSTLTKGATFSPTSITFLAGSAPVTINGDFTTLTSIANNSSVNQTFADSVDFGSGNIDVTQTGVCNSGSSGVDCGCVVFKGSVTGKNIVNHTVFSGTYTLTTTDKLNFKASGASRGTVNADSTFNVGKTDQIHELYLMDGATFHVEEASHGWGDWNDRNNSNHRLRYRSAGTFVADSYTLTGNGRMWLGGYLNNSANAAANANAVLKIGTLSINSNGALILHGYGNSGDALTTYVGAGGLNIASGKTG